MKQAAIFISMAFIFAGCELFVIGTPHKEPAPEINQNSALGAIYLFKAGLDSNNIRAATEIFANSDGSPVLAVEKYEMFDELDRMRRLIGSKPVTLVKTDSITRTTYDIRMEFDYLRTVLFTASKISDNWYIIGYRE
ncbi:MAG: hypothetical protein ACLFQX_12885 [Candidatus Kapaibacterium sp.]